ncbi:MAG: SMP-30/gluconolactonase/LRE family protein, partial [Planctomycetes bacterium]|nr:SMP-30/gluconolactonase/LRE family protein [Planctomycetota bacterium]
MRNAFSIAIVLALMGQLAMADVSYLDTFTGLEYPGRLAPTAGGGIYVTDQPVGQIVEFDAAGEVIGTYSIPELPIGIAVDLASGNIFVSRGDGQVGIYDATFTLQGTLDPTPFTLTKPNDLAVDPLTGEVYVVESAEQMIMVFDGTTGGLLRVWGAEGSELSELMHPQAIALDPALGHVIVADVDNSRVQVFDTTGVLQFKFGYRILYLPGSETAWFARAEGLAVDSCSNIYITDALMGTVRVFDETGVELDPDHLPAIGFGSGPGELQVPCDVLIDGSAMYVADTNGAAVEVYSVSCTPLPLGPGHGGGLPPHSKHADKKTKLQAAPSRSHKSTPTIPDNPFEIVAAMEAGEYVRDLDLNRDRSIDIADLEIAVEGFGGADPADFLDKDWGFMSNSYDPPHVIDLPYACGRCHAMDGLPGGMLSDWGQENLCLSCHSSGKLALHTPIGGSGMGNSHPWGVAADSGDVAGPDPDSELALHLDDGDVRCGTCHEPHQLGEGDYLRAHIDRGQLCGECHTETAQWLHAGHADQNGEAFVHYDWTQPNRASCRRCHSGYGFIDFSNGLPDEEQRGDFRVLDCVVCHAPHGSDEPDLLRVYDEV